MAPLNVCAAVAMEDFEKLVLARLKRCVQVLKDLRRWHTILIFCFVQQANALERLAHIVSERNARQYHFHVLAAKNSVDALETFAA